jgi:hypothetical protein
MNTFRVKLSDWMKANPGINPKYPIWVKTTFGSGVMMSGEFIEFFSSNEVLIKNKFIYKISGYTYEAEIELPLSILKEIEVVRDDKLNDLLNG